MLFQCRCVIYLLKTLGKQSWDEAFVSWLVTASAWLTSTHHVTLMFQLVKANTRTGRSMKWLNFVSAAGYYERFKHQICQQRRAVSGNQHWMFMFMAFIHSFWTRTWFLIHSRCFISSAWLFLISTQAFQWPSPIVWSVLAHRDQNKPYICPLLQNMIKYSSLTMYCKCLSYIIWIMANVILNWEIDN